MKAIALEIGQEINWWTVLDNISIGGKHAKVFCRCRCGREQYVEKYYLTSGKSSKCYGCSCRIKMTRHGMSGRQKEDRVYRIWKAMKWRCNPKNNGEEARDYVEKGITVCDLLYLAKPKRLPGGVKIKDVWSSPTHSR